MPEFVLYILLNKLEGLEFGDYEQIEPSVYVFGKPITRSDGTHFYSQAGKEIGIFRYKGSITEEKVVKTLDELSGSGLPFEKLYYEFLKDMGGRPGTVTDLDASEEDIEKVLGPYMSFIRLERVEDFKAKAGL